MNFQHTADCQGTPESPCRCFPGLWSVYFPASKGGEFMKVTLMETKVFEQTIAEHISKALMEAFVDESLVDIGRKQVADLMAYQLQDMMKALETVPWTIMGSKDHMAGMATGVGASPTWVPACPVCALNPCVCSQVPMSPCGVDPPCDGSGYLCTTHEPPLAATAPEVILDIYDGRAK